MRGNLKSCLAILTYQENRHLLYISNRTYQETITEEFEIGSKVTYTANKKVERGIIKSFTASNSIAYVVYYCDNNWDNYSDYTAQATAVDELRLGWDDE